MNKPYATYFLAALRRGVPLLVLLCQSLSLRAEPLKVDARLSMIAQLQTTSPCVASLIGPPTTSCIPWQANVDAAATFEPSRRLIFAGAGDNFLHILDGDSGKSITQRPTQGRVVTETVFDKGTSLYVGTDKGVVHAFDAYSFQSIFSFQADSKINNDLVIVDDALLFSTALGTLYAVDRSKGDLRWRFVPPKKTGDRMRLAHYSNLVVLDSVKGEEASVVLPHASGAVYVVGLASGNVKYHLQLAPEQSKGFSDIVAPMVWFKNKLWVASYDSGIFGIDMVSKNVVVIPIKEVVQLASNGVTLFAASADMIYAISGSLGILWKNPIVEVKSQSNPAGFPFNRLIEGSRRMFYGMPSRLLLGANHIIFATSAGSLGFINKATGILEKLVGNGVGFGPKISWFGATQLMAISERGLLMKFQIFDPTRSSR